MSGTGSKRVLAHRLYTKGVKGEASVRSFVLVFIQQGKDSTIDPTEREKAPNWNKNETARLVM